MSIESEAVLSSKAGAEPVRPDVLLIEDEPSSRDALEAVLRLAGFEVRTADDGYDGLREISRRKPDLVLTDISMPGLTGLQVVQAVREAKELAGIPVFAITSTDRHALERDGATDLFDRVFHKPVGLSHLLAAVESALA